MCYTHHQFSIWYYYALLTPLALIINPPWFCVYAYQNFTALGSFTSQLKATIQATDTTIEKMCTAQSHLAGQVQSYHCSFYAPLPLLLVHSNTYLTSCLKHNWYTLVIYTLNFLGTRIFPLESCTSTLMPITCQIHRCTLYCYKTYLRRYIARLIAFDIFPPNNI